MDTAGQERRYTGLRALLWVICLYHVACGAIANLWSDQIPALAQSLAGMHVKDAAEFIYLAKPLGIYAVAFGIMMGLAAWDPVKNRAVITVGVILFALRILQRLAGMDELDRVFGVSPTRSLLSVAVVASFGVALAWLRYRLYRDMHSKSQTP